MRNPQGYALWSGDTKDTKERDTITCCHCNCVVPVDPVNLNIGFCRMCMDHICLPCADKGICSPFERQLEKMESRARLLKSI